MSKLPATHLFVLSAPSGAGKTSLVRALLAADPTLAVSVSHTTRAPRPNERNGREYHFTTAADFADLVLAGGFLEHAQVFDNHYGTGRDLRERLHTRATDSPEVIARRLADAQSDMAHWHEFDYVVVNDDFAVALAQLQQIIAGDGEALRADRPALQPLLANLLA